MIIKKIVLLLIGVLLQSIATGTAENIPAVPYIQNNEYIIRLIRFERFGPDYDNFKFVFAVKNKVTQHEYFIEMKNLTTQLIEVEIIDNLLVVFGAIRDVADVVTIFDLIHGEEKDSILCYAPRLSETKRHIIYRQFYPRMSDPPAMSSLILVYDLKASPLDNRVGSEAKKSLTDGIEVGYPIFPEENVQKQSYSIWVEAEQERHAVVPWAGYLWLDQDSKVVFVDKHRGENWLVLADLSKGAHS